MPEHSDHSRQGMDDLFPSLFNQTTDAVFILGSKNKIVEANPAATKLLGYTREELIQKRMADLLSPEYLFDDIQEKSSNESKSIPCVTVHREGKPVYVEMQVIHFCQQGDNRDIAIVRDRNEPKHSENLQQAVYQISEAANFVQNLEDLFYKVHQIVSVLIPAKNFYIALFHPNTHEVSFPYFVDTQRSQPPPRKNGNGFTEYLILTGKPLIISSNDKMSVQIDGYKINSYSYTNRLGIPLRTADDRIIGALVVQTYNKNEYYTKDDIEILTFVSTQIAMTIERKRTQNDLQENENKYRTLFESSTEGFYLFKDKFEDCNEQACRLWACERADIIGHNLLDFSPILQAGGMLSTTMYQIYKDAAFDGAAQYFYWTCLCKNGSLIDTEISLKSVIVGGARYLLMTLRDISERLRAEERIRHQLQRLAALRAIDASISTSVDINRTLKLVIENSLNLLNMDAGAILLLNHKTNSLEYVAIHGFSKNSQIQTTVLERGKGYPWKSMVERHLVINNQLDGNPEIPQAILLENFSFYCCAPLIAKGEMRGAMELFNHDLVHPNQEWFDLMETLAGQATIALDNSFLFSNLKRANEDLIKAYDITIEGWARALEMRDMETEGHSRRVTDLTIHLARKMGIEESQMEHIRRGALLHDIGKMGIPDHVLLKAGPLDEQEWEIMRRHPTYAYEMLSDIEFLSPALDIPYFHQERWDGSGYPLGLKGEEIPLPARIFAIVDVWDALTSTRPYRIKWSREKTARYICDNANILFDPKVVEAFMEIIQ